MSSGITESAWTLDTTGHDTVRIFHTTHSFYTAVLERILSSHPKLHLDNIRSWQSPLQNGRINMETLKTHSESVRSSHVILYLRRSCLRRSSVHPFASQLRQPNLTLVHGLRLDSVVPHTTSLSVVRPYKNVYSCYLSSWGGALG